MIICQPGKENCGGDTTLTREPPWQNDVSIVFRLGNETEVMRFDPDGTVKVRGEVVDSNEAVYLAFREWLRNATYIKPTETLYDALGGDCR